MQFNLASNEFWMTPSLQEYLQSKMRDAFSDVKCKTMHVMVRLRDLAGQDDGRDKMCQISVTLPNKPKIFITDVQENMYAAIDTAVKKAAHRTKRILMCKRSGISKTIPSETTG